MMKKLIVPICILLLSITSFSQTRSRTTKRGTQSSKTPKVAAQPGVEARTNGATRVAEAARKNEASPAALQQNDQNKAVVKTSLRNVREGLDQLEVYFRGTPELEGYYLKLAGSASGAATAEDQAAAGHFDQAGRTLLGVVNRLT